MFDIDLSSKDVFLLCAGSAFGLGASLIANVITGPLLSGLTGYFTIRALSFLRPLRDRGFDGAWDVGWHSRSTRFGPHPTDRVRIHSFWSWVAFEARFASDGEFISYRFYGRNRGGVISGRWFDPRSDDGYHGQFQVLRAGDLRSATGSWLGFSSEQGVEANSFRWSKPNAVVTVVAAVAE